MFCTRYYTLSNAQTRARRTQARVFGGDHLGQKGMVKFFVVDTELSALRAIYRCAPLDRNYYELLDSERPCLAYFDVDVSLKAMEGEYAEGLARVLSYSMFRDLTTFHRECVRNGMSDDILQYLRVFMMRFMRRELSDIFGRDVGVRFLDASDSRKFSLHIHTDVPLQSHVVEGNPLACELNRRLLKKIWMLWRSATETDPNLVRLILLFPRKLPTDVKNASVEGVFDCSVYSRNRLFRLFGNTKKGSYRFLRKCSTDGSSVEPLPERLGDLCSIAASYLIQRLQGLDFSDEIAPRVYCFDASASAYSSTASRRAYALRPSDIKGSETPLTTYEGWDGDIRRTGLACFLECRGGGNSPRVPSEGSAIKRNNNGALTRRMCQSSRCGDDSRCRVILSDDLLYLEGAKDGIQAANLGKGDVVHCLECDLTTEGAPDNNPSAVALETDDLDIAYYCFACEKLFVVRHRVDYDGFKEEADVKVFLGDDDRYFSERILRDVFDADRHKVVAVNARMGTGKTEAASRVLAGKSRILLVTYRQSLARQLASRFNAFLYLEDSGRVHSSDRDRVVVCLDSLMRVAPEGYEYIVLDEAGFIRRHFMGSTMRGKREMIYDRLAAILNYSKKILLLQDGLTQADIEFYTLLLHSNSLRNSAVKIYVEKKSHLVDARLSTDLHSVLCLLHDHIKAGKKVFVPVSLKRLAVVLYDFVITKCFPPSYRSDEQWTRKVCLVVGVEDICRGVRNGLEFIDRYTEFDVVIATSVLETGVSLDGHYTHVVGFFHRIPLTHRSQVQLVNRVRCPERIDVYLEKGLNFRQRVNKKLLARMFVTETVVSPPFRSTYVDIVSENADVYNHNELLWEDNWESQLFEPRYGSEGPSPEVIKCFQKLIKAHTTGIRKYLQSTEVTSVTFDSERRAALIRDQALLREDGVLRLLRKEALWMAKTLKCEVEHLDRRFWRTIFYFMLDGHERMEQSARHDSPWQEVLRCSGERGDTAPFLTAAVVQVGRRLMMCTFGAALPRDGASFYVTDTTFPTLISELKRIQRWIGTRNYTHTVGLLGPFIRQLQALFGSEKSVNRKLVELFRKVTPFAFRCNKRKTVQLHGEYVVVRAISLHWPVSLGIILAGSIRTYLYDDVLLRAMGDALDRKEETSFRSNFDEWARSQTGAAHCGETAEQENDERGSHTTDSIPGDSDR